ncbi:MAG: hypothetical protein LBU83_02005 [Bacteroidales bacterium]|jgi:hypothetical protein|nr:hypothetical protein [Bacteroidales bacterium]
MKKTFFIAMIAMIAFALVLNSCKKEEKEEETTPIPEPTKTELLTQPKGWVLFSATSMPAYKNKDGETSEDLFRVYFDECELDDILIFKADKSAELNYGEKKCEDGDGNVKPLGLWRFLQNEEVLEFRLPYFEDNEDQMLLLEGKVSALDESTLTLRIPITFADNPAKGQAKNLRGIKNAKGDAEYQFILTFKVAK